MKASSKFPWQRLLSIAFALLAIKNTKRTNLFGIGAAALWTWPGWLRNVPGSLPVMRSFRTDEREVWLTIDDGPNRHDTEGMLAELEEASAVATFFPIGFQAAARPDMVRKIVAAGHTVGNHTYSHRSGTFWIEPGFSVRADIVQAQKVLQSMIGSSPLFYRAPAGRWTWEQAREAQKLGLTCVGWSAAGGDGMCAGDLWESMNCILDSLLPGAVIVVHQGGRFGRVEALRFLVHRLQQGGWKTIIPSHESLRTQLP